MTMHRHQTFTEGAGNEKLETKGGGMSLSDYCKKRDTFILESGRTFCELCCLRAYIDNGGVCAKCGHNPKAVKQPAQERKAREAQ